MIPAPRSSPGRVAGGFTLIELATVLAVIALLLGAVLVPLSTQMDSSRYNRARTQLDTAKEALIGFAVANGNRLPCPDSTGDGLADPLGVGPCTATEGFLPFATLGLQQFDPWGNRLRYRPYPAFTGDVGPPFIAGLPALPWNALVAPWSSAALAVQDRAGNPLTAAATAAPAAVLFSCGKNGSADAANNGDNSLGAVARCGVPASPLDTTYNQDVFVDGTFDDVVDWLSTPALVARLVSAGTWPG